MAKYQFQGQKSDLNRHTQERPFLCFPNLNYFAPTAQQSFANSITLRDRNASVILRTSADCGFVTHISVGRNTSHGHSQPPY